MKLLRYVAFILVMAAPAGAATNPFGVMNTGSKTSAIPVDVTAPSMDFEQGGKKLVASGGVTMIRGDEKLTANTIIVDKVSDEALASGNVVFIKSNLVWRGETFTYTLKDGTWKSSGFSAEVEPFHIHSDGAYKTNDFVLLNRAEFTTCTIEPGDYPCSMACKRMRIYPGDHFVARHMVIRFGGIPMFYLPYWYCALNDRTVGTTVMAGYRGRMGAFLLTSTKYWMTPTLKWITHVDYRTARGPAIGQEVGWISTNGLSKGRIYAYAMDDQGVKKDFETGNHAVLVDSQRYRLSFDHSETFSPRDYFLSDVTYLSDQYVLADFFEREFRYSFQPQNYATLMHRGDDFTVSLSAYGRVNDFFESVNRLPELAFDVQRVEIGDSPFYYEGKNSLDYLQKTYAAGSGASDYSAARFDTSHEFYYPTRHFGFLNVTPRAGVEETFYSDTVEYSTVTQMVSALASNMLVGTSNVVVSSSSKTNVSTMAKSSGSDMRSLLNVGLETSFRAFKLLSNEENAFGTGWRHVVEPYTDYTYMPEPNIRPDRLYQFDEIDALDRRNDLKFGVRNFFQTKREGSVTDVIDLDVFTTYSFESTDNDQPFSNVGWAGEFHPSDVCHFYADGTYDLYASQVSTFNTRALVKQDSWRASLESRYIANQDSLLTSDLGYLPNTRWEFGIYDRYDFQASQLEEQGVTVARKYDCMVVTVGGSYMPSYIREDGTVHNDEYRLMFQLWFSAFPNVKLGSGRRE